MFLKKCIYIYVYNAKIKDVEYKISDFTNLATNTKFNAKVNEIKNEIPSIANLATTTFRIVFENKTPDHSKYITTLKFNKLTAESFTARLKQTNLATEGDIADFIKKDRFQ